MTNGLVNGRNGKVVNPKTIITIGLEPEVLEDISSLTACWPGVAVVATVWSEVLNKLAQVDGPAVLLAEYEDMLPKYIEQLRSFPTQKVSDIPIVVFGYREDYVPFKILEAGADCYILHPINLAELAARVRAILRRGPLIKKDPPVIVIGDLSLNIAMREVLVRGTPVHLTPSEYILLCALAKNPGQLYTVKKLVTMLHGEHEEVDPQSVKVHVGNLRRKFRWRGNTGLIRSIHGEGYCIAVEAA